MKAGNIYRYKNLLIPLYIVGLVLDENKEYGYIYYCLKWFINIPHSFSNTYSLFLIVALCSSYLYTNMTFALTCAKVGELSFSFALKMLFLTQSITTFHQNMVASNMYFGYQVLTDLLGIWHSYS